MAQRRIDKLVLAVAVTGVIAVIIAFCIRWGTRSEYMSLYDKVGRFEIADEQQVHVKRLDTDDANEFAWQIYLPPAKTPRVGLETKGYVGGIRYHSAWKSWPEDGRESTIRVAVRRTSGGVEACGHGIVIGIREPVVSHFVERHWDELEFNAVATDGMLVQSSDKLIRLFEATLSEQLVDEFVLEHGPEHSAQVAVPFAFYLGDSSSQDWPDIVRQRNPNAN